ncbi:MAG: Gfo/Idh/MocA family oxidoreductase [Chloroflexi bacterium]|nr:Gfo/Idh/MocA family oxidoreductase [Chloroflexota bacterium]
MHRFGVGLIGTGMSAAMHAEALHEVPEARVVAVLGSSGEKASAFARRWAILRAYHQLDEFVADPEIDAVHLCTPPYLHELHARAAARAGKHILVEKPMARTVQEADRIIAEAQGAGVQLGAMFQHRFMPLPRQVKDALDAGRLGQLYLADCSVKWWRAPEYYQGSRWRGKLDLEGGGALINQAIHTIDLLCWFAGPVARIVAHCATIAHAIEAEDLGVGLLRFANGAVGVVEGSSALYPGFPERIELHGANGSIILNEGLGTIDWLLRGEANLHAERAEQRGAASSDPARISLVGHTAEFRDFYQALAQGRPPALSGAEGRKALEIVQAMRLSQQTGQPVDLPLRVMGDES